MDLNVEKMEDATALDVSENLESGTSLSEAAYHGQIVPERSSLFGTSCRTVEELRSQLAMDAIITSGPSPITTFDSPFELPTTSAHIKGPPVKLPLVYCDHTASNRPLQSVEDYVRETCLPLYGNTHTTTSITGSQSTALVTEARQIIAEGVNAKTTGKASQDVVLFSGNGATSAVELLIDCIGLRNWESLPSGNDRPVVFLGPHEHHSNMIPWRETGCCDIVMVPENSRTQTVDFEALEQLLQKYSNRTTLKLGTFCAASNVTGNVVDTNRVTKLLHQYGALAIFDYATGASYLEMNMNPVETSETDGTVSSASLAKDAIFFSPHKMIGGIGTPGVLVLKKHMFLQLQNPPRRSGGGTVFYVTESHHRFLSNRIERYEGGTPHVTGIWRAGLTFLAKRRVESAYQRIFDGNRSGPAIPKSILEFDYQTHARVTSALRDLKNIVLLGDAPNNGGAESNPSKLPIFSFLIKCGVRFLHYNFVCAVLNDVFGIQSRGGCQCAGPYSQRLLGLTETHVSGNSEEHTSTPQYAPNAANRQLEDALLHAKERAELLRPGFTRLSLPYKGLSSAEVEYVIAAIAWTARNAWKLLCCYRCNHRTGEWRHKRRQGAPLGRTERKWLSHYQPQFLTNDATPRRDRSGASTESLESVLQNTLRTADKLVEAACSDQSSISQTLKLQDDALSGDAVLEKLRWYVYPKDVVSFLTQGLSQVPGSDDRENLVGALKPLAWYPAAIITKDKLPTESHTDCDGLVCSAVSDDPVSSTDSDLDSTSSSSAPSMVSPKMSSSSFRSLSAPVTSSDRDDAMKSSSSIAPSTYSFRDGEHHSGEATFIEIEAGYNEGELSEDCDIYNPEEGAWESIQSFLQFHTPGPISPPEATDIAPADMAVGQAPVPFAETTPITSRLNSTLPVQETPMPPLPVAIDEKNQKKKPSRDSSMWGQNNAVTVELPVIVNMDIQDLNSIKKSAAVATAVDENDISKKEKRSKTRHIKPPAKMMRLVTQAMIQWDMLEEGDRLLLGLSGGKDSLSLLHCLMEFQRKLPINFEIEVCTIDPMTPSFDPSPLIPYVESLGLKYHYIRDDIVERAAKSGKDGNVVSSLCAYCARMKRGNLYTCARQNNCNKLVLAQHLDDLAESFLMSVMHNGFLRTMKANYKINAGDLSVIRPLAYCRESLMADFAQSANLPIINENCPACFEEPKERARIKKLLSREETLYPNFYDNIRRSLLPLMHDDSTSILRCYTEEALAKSRRDSRPKGQKSTKAAKQCDVKNEDAEVGSVALQTTVPEVVPKNEMNNKPNGRAAFGNPNEDKASTTFVADASEEELIRELARRRAEKFRLAGSMKRLENGEADDPTGQVCTLNGGNGTIPCRELME